MDRVKIYIDSSNLYLGAKDVCGCGKVDIGKFSRHLADGRPLLQVKYFCVDPPEPNISHFNIQTREGKDKYAAAALSYTKQLSWLNHLQHWKRIKVVKGRLQRNQKSGKLTEKGVDVALALHLVIDSAMKEFETAIVVSGDADLALAIETAISWGMKVEAAAFQPCWHVAELCKRFKFTELNKNSISPFIKFPKP